MPIYAALDELHAVLRQRPRFVSEDKLHLEESRHPPHCTAADITAGPRVEAALQKLKGWGVLIHLCQPFAAFLTWSPATCRCLVWAPLGYCTTSLILHLSICCTAVRRQLPKPSKTPFKALCSPPSSYYLAALLWLPALIQLLL